MVCLWLFIKRGSISQTKVNGEDRRKPCKGGYKIGAVCHDCDTA